MFWRVMGLNSLRNVVLMTFNDASLVSVLVAPEGFKTFDGGPGGLVSFCGMGFLQANDVGLCCQSEKFLVFTCL